MNQIRIILVLCALVFGGAVLLGQPAGVTIDKDAEAAARASIPLGGDLRPDPRIPALVAVGHGGRIVLSTDDGASWEQVFFGYAGHDHGMWATRSVAYTNGVFVVNIGWTNPTTYLASEDGRNWRHLTDGSRSLVGGQYRDDPSVMPTTFGIAGGRGAIVGGGFNVFTASSDFGKTWATFSTREFAQDLRPRRLNTHHIRVFYLGDASGRFLAVGQDRSKEDTKMGNFFATDDLGQSWTWLEPLGLDAGEAIGGVAVLDGKVILVDRLGAMAWVSSDGGSSFDGPFSTQGGGRGANLSQVGDEVWLTGATPMASKDGKSWRPLPSEVPIGTVVRGHGGSLIAISSGRLNILRSTDNGNSWSEVFQFSRPDEIARDGGQGLQDIAVGYLAPASGN